jgi:hypothetical protein
MSSNDIVAFNGHVRDLRKQLALCNQTMDDNDLLIHLIDGYKAAKDSAFCTCMSQKQERIMYFNDPANSIDEVMELAEQVYTDRINRGDWARPSRDQEKIVVLEAQLKSLSVKPNKGKKGKDSTGKEDGKNYSYEPEQAWKWEPPTDGAPKVKTVKNAKFHWCPNHQHRLTKAWGMWSRHQPSECKAAANRPSSGPGSNPNKDRGLHTLNTIIEQHAEHEDGDEYDYPN